MESSMLRCLVLIVCTTACLWSASTAERIDRFVTDYEEDVEKAFSSLGKKDLRSW